MNSSEDYLPKTCMLAKFVIRFEKKENNNHQSYNHVYFRKMKETTTKEKHGEINDEKGKENKKTKQCERIGKTCRNIKRKIIVKVNRIRTIGAHQAQNHVNFQMHSIFSLS